MSDAPVLLLTRPRPQSEALRDALAQRLATAPACLIAPLQEIALTDRPIGTEGYAGLIFTSGNGLRAFLAASPVRDLPAFCVGDQTAAAAREAGFDARSAGGDALALEAMLLRDRPPGPLLHPRGERQRLDLAARLSFAGIETQSQVVYRQEDRPLSDEGRALLAGGRPVIAPLYSPHSARLFATAATGAAAPLTLVALGPAVAAEVAGLAATGLLTAPRPDGATMIALLCDLLAKAASA